VSIQQQIRQVMVEHPEWTSAQIARSVGCQPEYVRVCTRRLKLIAERKRITNWTREECDTLVELRDVKKMKWENIAAAMGKSYSATHAKYNYIMTARARIYVSNGVTIPDERDLDRRHRQTLEPRDLTAAFMGDPLPGYSALERQA
jgi:hypothetical protein